MGGQEVIRILVVDDDEDDHFIIVSEIKEYSDSQIDITCCTNSKDAIEILGQKPIDVILCDYRMGRETGLDFIRNIGEKGIDAPVILLTGVNDRFIDTAGLEAGAVDFIAKSDMTGPILDRSIRYAIANADRQRLLQAVLAHSASGVAVIDSDGNLSLQNNHFLSLSEAWSGAVDSDSLRQFALDILALEGQDIDIGDRVVERHVTKMPDGNMVLILHDVTDRVKALKDREAAEKRMVHAALHDDLTGLPNRAAFNIRLDDELRIAAQQNHRVFLLTFDHDKFKEINDVFGHAIGDQLLIETANRIRGLCDSSWFFARLGGDEFVAMCRSDARGKEIPGLAHSIVSAMQVPLTINDKLISTSVSIGVARFPDHGSTREELLANADAAMYRAKAEPNNRICIFDESMDQSIRERRAIANDLKDAVLNSELRLHFQPQAAVSSGKIVGFEALSRWESPTRGSVPPSTFISIAEDTGTILPIGAWALKEACRTAGRWGSGYKVAVNVSPVQIAHSDLPTLVEEALSQTGIKASQLELEVTEATIITDFDRALAVFKELKSLGVSIAMDDFGTGYSSLSALQAFPVDRIKIDRSFVFGIDDEKAQSSEIVRAIIGLGRSMNIPVLAEGVETQSHVDFLASEHCECMQGFFIGRPESVESVEQLFAIDHTDQETRVSELKKRLDTAA